MEHVEPADAYLALRADDPDLLAGIDPMLHRRLPGGHS